LEGSGWPLNCEPPLVQKIRGSVHYFILFLNAPVHKADVTQAHVRAAGKLVPAVLGRDRQYQKEKGEQVDDPGTHCPGVDPHGANHATGPLLHRDTNIFISTFNAYYKNLFRI
jgi:hypothetical protein